MRRLHALTVRVARRLGAMVCRYRGHCFFFPNGSIDSWCAYTCVRCGELSQSLESLPYAPDDYERDSWHDADEDTRIEAERARNARWMSFLPFPRWLS